MIEIIKCSNNKEISKEIDKRELKGQTLLNIQRVDEISGKALLTAIKHPAGSGSVVNTFYELIFRL